MKHKKIEIINNYNLFIDYEVIFMIYKIFERNLVKTDESKQLFKYNENYYLEFDYNKDSLKITLLKGSFEVVKRKLVKNNEQSN